MVSCDQLSSAAAASDLLGVSSAAIDPQLRNLNSFNDDDRKIDAAGGTTCIWGSETAANPESTDASHLTVRVLPNAASAWDTLAGFYPDTSAPGAEYDGYASRDDYCSADRTGASCATNVLVGHTWLAVGATSYAPGSLTPESFRSAVITMIPAVEKLGDVAPATGADPLRAACYADGYAAAVATSFGVPQASLAEIENMFRVEAAVGLRPGSQFCPYQPSVDGSGGFVASLTVIPTATTQFAEYRQLLATQGIPATELPLTSAGSTVTGVGRSFTSYGTARYTFDFLSEDAWVSIKTTDGPAAPAHSAAFAQWVLDHG
jgi:hypothetical protein